MWASSKFYGFLELHSKTPRVGFVATPKTVSLLLPSEQRPGGRAPFHLPLTQAHTLPKGQRPSCLAKLALNFKGCLYPMAQDAREVVFSVGFQRLPHPSSFSSFLKSGFGKHNGDGGLFWLLDSTQCLKYFWSLGQMLSSPFW